MDTINATKYNLSTSYRKNKVTRERNPLRKKCNKCEKLRLHDNKNAQQCNFCNQIMLSGNKFIDNLLVKLNKQKVFIEFIPYEYFKNIIYLSEGGFSKIYKATCVNGIRTEWNSRKRRFAEAIINATVVLKCLNSSEAISHDFLNELKNYFQCSDGYYILQYYGITQHPETKDYMIVMAFAENGDLYNYISKNFLTISWKQKLGALRNIAWGLKTIHDKKIIHRDLHSGNILIHRGNNPRNVDFGVKMGDFGISKPANEITDTKEIYGNKQLSKMDLSFLCSKRILYYYQQESASPSHSNLNIPKTHQLYENNFAYNDVHNKNKRQKYNEDAHYQDNHNYQSKEFEFDINR
ncbi:16560_t:CDS:2 [Cetraspora pellucida]|uniref:16560_t:CDS:1 n=1 Tax=Cetraspora pellucida TaxID=1433469 RepID=A0A9N9GCQ7_9GLOM|nr:16560_t:CDS:2 [Cetraspora pellucida]